MVSNKKKTDPKCFAESTLILKLLIISHCKYIYNIDFRQFNKLTEQEYNKFHLNNQHLFKNFSLY